MQTINNTTINKKNGLSELMIELQQIADFVAEYYGKCDKEAMDNEIAASLNVAFTKFFRNPTNNNGDYGAIKELLNTTNNPFNKHLLTFAAKNGYAKTLEMILKYGADPTIVYDEQGRTALEIAKNNRNKTIMDFLGLSTDTNQGKIIDCVARFIQIYSLSFNSILTKMPDRKSDIEQILSKLQKLTHWYDYCGTETVGFCNGLSSWWARNQLVNKFFKSDLMQFLRFEKNLSLTAKQKEIISEIQKEQCQAKKDDLKKTLIASLSGSKEQSAILSNTENFVFNLLYHHYDHPELTNLSSMGNVYSICGNFDKTLLKEHILELLPDDYTPVLISNNAHRIAIMRAEEYIICFDPNNPYLEVKIPKEKAHLVVDFIYRAMSASHNTSLNLGFTALAGNEPALTADEINQITQRYPDKISFLKNTEAPAVSDDNLLFSLLLAIKSKDLKLTDYFAKRCHNYINKTILFTYKKIPYTALSYAIANKFYPCIEILLKHGLDPNVCEENGHPRFVNFLLHDNDADSAEKIKTIKAFLIAGARVNPVCKNGWNLLKAFGREPTILNLKVAIFLSTYDILKIDPEGKESNCTVLTLAAKNDRVDLIESILADGADVNKLDGNGDTPLMLAVEKGNVKVIAALLRANARINYPYNKENPLIMAIKKRRIDIVTMLLDAGADILNFGNGNSPLITAIEQGDADIVKLLLARGADINQCDGAGRSNLMTAVLFDRDYLIPLLAKEHNVNKEGRTGQTPLTVAVAKGHIKTIKQLLRAGAFINKADMLGNHPLTYAKGDTIITDLLLSYGANPLKTQSNQTALSLAAKNNRINLIKELLANGAFVNSSNGSSLPLMMAVKKNNIDAIKILLLEGASRKCIAKLLDLKSDIAPEAYAVLELGNSVFSIFEEVKAITKTEETSPFHINQEYIESIANLLYAAKKSDPEFFKSMINRFVTNESEKKLISKMLSYHETSLCLFDSSGSIDACTPHHIIGNLS